MGKIYLIDYENTGVSGLTGCSRLQKSDRILLFFTKNNSKIDMNAIADHGEAELRMLEVPSGKQSADLHIGSYLGYLVSENRSGATELIVVSNDTGFDNLLAFWKPRTEARLRRVPAIGAPADGAPAPAPKAAPATKKSASKAAPAAKKEPVDKTAVNNETMKLLSAAGFAQEIAAFTASLTARYAGENNAKQQIYRAVISKYGQKQGLEIYSLIKKNIK